MDNQIIIGNECKYIDDKGWEDPISIDLNNFSHSNKLIKGKKSKLIHSYNKHFNVIINQYIGVDIWDSSSDEVKQILYKDACKKFKQYIITKYGNEYEYHKFLIKRMGFKSESEYLLHLAKKNGFNTILEHRISFAGKKGGKFTPMKKFTPMNHEDMKKWSIKAGFKDYTDYQNYLARRLGFKNYYKLCDSRIKKRGFESPKKYRDYLAKKRGFKNDTERALSNIQKRGFKDAYEYQKDLIAKKGFNTVAEYKKHLGRGKC